MTGDGKNNELIPCFMSLLTDEEKLLYGQIINYLLELGYTPKKNKVQGYSLSFKHKKLNKTIARMGIHGGKIPKTFFGIRFFACKSYSQKFYNAIEYEIVSRNGQYCTEKSSDVFLDKDSLAGKNRCGCCASCTGGGLGYYYKYPGGKEVVRCGAYPIVLPNFDANDIDEVKSLLLEQHYYFLSIA